MAPLWKYVLQIGSEHGVNPWIFGILYLAHHPLFWGTFALVIHRVRRQRPYKALLALDVFFWFMPYLYVLFFSRHLPWWVYLLILTALALGAPHTVKEMRRRLSLVDRRREPSSEMVSPTPNDPARSPHS
jgi:hypothetical protein